jgi:hypothetical protein
MSEEAIAAALQDLMATVDRVPATALQAANASFGWRTVDADLAALTADAGRAAAHRRGGQPRLLTFSRGQTTIELEVSSAGGVARLLGQLDPPRQAEITVESAGLTPGDGAGSRATRADSQGRFSVPGLVAGWTRVVVAPADGQGERISTEWFRA